MESYEVRGDLPLTVEFLWITMIFSPLVLPPITRELFIVLGQGPLLVIIIFGVRSVSRGPLEGYVETQGSPLGMELPGVILKIFHPLSTSTLSHY